MKTFSIVIFVITTLSPEQFSYFNTKEEIRNINEYEGGVVVFDDILDSKQKAIDPFFLQEDVIKI